MFIIIFLVVVGLVFVVVDDDDDAHYYYYSAIVIMIILILNITVPTKNSSLPGDETEPITSALATGAKSSSERCVIAVAPLSAETWNRLPATNQQVATRDQI